MPEGVQVAISAQDLTGPAFQAAIAKSQAFQASMGGVTGSFKEAHAASRLLSDELGIKLNRELTNIISRSSALQGALSFALPVAGAIGFLGVAGQIGDTLKNAYDVISGTKAMDEAIEASARLQESLHKIAEKTAEAAAAYERLGKSAQTVAIMDKAAAAGELQSKQAQLTMLKSMLAAQEHLATQTSPTLGKATTYAPTDAAKAAQEMIPKLREQIALLTNGMKVLEIGSASAGKKMDESLVTAFDKATAAAERHHAALVKWDLMWNKIRSNNEFLTAPAQAALDKEQIPGGWNPPDWMSGLSTADTNPLYSGSREAMNQITLQQSQTAAIAAAQDVYEQTRTAAQRYSDTMAQLAELLNQGRISQQQFSAAASQAAAGLNTHAKEWKQFGKEIDRNILNAATFQESWSQAFKSIAVDLAKLLLQMYVLDALSNKFGGGGGFWGKVFGGMGSGGGGLDTGAISFGGGFASGGSIAPGMWGLVGEKGPELAYGGTSGLNITPNKALGGVVYQDFRGAVVTDDLMRRSEAARGFSAVKTQAVREAVYAVQERNARR